VSSNKSRNETDAEAQQQRTEERHTKEVVTRPSAYHSTNILKVTGEDISVSSLVQSLTSELIPKLI